MERSTLLLGFGTLVENEGNGELRLAIASWVELLVGWHVFCGSVVNAAVIVCWVVCRFGPTPGRDRRKDRFEKTLCPYAQMVSWNSPLLRRLSS